MFLVNYLKIYFNHLLVSDQRAEQNTSIQVNEKLQKYRFQMPPLKDSNKWATYRINLGKKGKDRMNKPWIITKILHKTILNNSIKMLYLHRSVHFKDVYSSQNTALVNDCWSMHFGYRASRLTGKPIKFKWKLWQTPFLREETNYVTMFFMKERNKM